MSNANIPLPPPMAPQTTTDASTETTAEITVRPKEVNTNNGDKKTIFQSCYVVVYLLTSPITVPFSILNYVFQQTKNISLVLINEVRKVASLGYNTFELGVLLIKSLNIIVFKDGNTKPLMPLMMDVYNKMADTLTDIHALPSTKESGTLIHLMLKRLPESIWETLLPYPHPFFKGSVTQASKTKSNKVITSMVKVPNDCYSPCPVAPEKSKSE